MKQYWNISNTMVPIVMVLEWVASTQKSNETILKHIKHKYAYCYRYLYWWHQHSNQMKRCWNISHINMPIVIGTNTGSINMEVKWNNTETYQTQWCQFLLVLVQVASTRKSNEMILKYINSMMPIVTGTSIIDMEVKWNDTETYQHNVASCYQYQCREHLHGSQMKWCWNISNTMVPIVTGIGTGSIDTEVKWKNTETYQHNDANCYWY
jgi:hypothetical protein